MTNDINIELIEQKIKNQKLNWQTLAEACNISRADIESMFTDLDFFHHIHILHKIAEHLDVRLNDLYKNKQ